MKSNVQIRITKYRAKQKIESCSELDTELERLKKSLLYYFKTKMEQSPKFDQFAKIFLFNNVFVS